MTRASVALRDIRTDGGTQSRASLFASGALPAFDEHPRWSACCDVDGRLTFAFVDRCDAGDWNVTVDTGLINKTKHPVRESFVAPMLAVLGFDTRLASWSKLPGVGPAHSDSVVYFVQSTAGGPVKIGWSASPERRVKDLECGSPFPLRILAMIPGNATTEGALHKRFAAHRLRGEWFAPHTDLLEYIAERRFRDARA